MLINLSYISEKQCFSYQNHAFFLKNLQILSAVSQILRDLTEY